MTLASHAVMSLRRGRRCHANGKSVLMVGEVFHWWTNCYASARSVMLEIIEAANTTRQGQATM